MKRTSTNTLVLCATADSMVVHLFASALLAAEPPKWLLLVPAGKIKTNDGRTFNNTDPAAVITASRPDLPIHIDFDHGTQTRGDSRAACWITELSAQGPNGETGIWGKAEWTPPGIQALTDKLYRFFSPTMNVVKGVVKKVVGGGLVNNPAIDELPALASTNQENALTLEELLAKLRTSLGLADTATVDDVMSAIATLNNNTAATASAKTVATIAAAAGLTLAAGTMPSNEQVTAICAKLTVPAANGDLATQVASLSSQLADTTGRLNGVLLSQGNKTAEETVDAAIAAFKVPPAARAENIALCKASPESYTAMLAKQPAVLRPGALPKTPAADGDLTDEQVALCRSMGVSEEAYKKTLAGQKVIA